MQDAPEIPQPKPSSEIQEDANKKQDVDHDNTNNENAIKNEGGRQKLEENKDRQVRKDEENIEGVKEEIQQFAVANQEPQEISRFLRGISPQLVPSHKLAEYSQAFVEGPINHKAKRFIGADENSVSIELEDGNVIRVSDKAFFDDEGTRQFDAPVIEDGRILASEVPGEVHYIIQPRMEGKVSAEDASSFRGNLDKRGYKFENFSPDKLGRHEGQLVLLDPQSVKRMVPATPKEKIERSLEKFEQEMRHAGFEKSDKYSADEIVEMEQEVIANLNKTFPDYDIASRLTGAERSTFVADRESFNGYALRYKFPGISGRMVGLLERLPLPAAGFAFDREISVVNGGLPKFLIKRTMYHEDLHLASAGLLPIPINEGATEYYARQAATKEGFAQNIMNPFYFPNAVTYALMSRAVGEDVAKEAYFNGEVGKLQSALDDSWGHDAYLKINKLSRGFFGIRALGYSVYKSLTSR